MKEKTIELTRAQRKVLTAAYGNDGASHGFGYAPCGRGYIPVFKSLAAKGLVYLTGSENNPRGIVLTKRGEEMAGGLI